MGCMEITDSRQVFSTVPVEKKGPTKSRKPDQGEGFQDEPRDG